MYQLHYPEKLRHHVLLSSPHSGTMLPNRVWETMFPEMAQSLDDTDWHIPNLYQFYKELDIPFLQAVYHRWVADLNRNPDGQQLYNDGRHITGLVSDSDFLGNKIYKEGGEPDQTEVDRRKELYFYPYHKAIDQLMSIVREEFGYALLWDAHSIRRLVPSIRQEPFPDFIIGTNSGQSCHPDIQEVVFQHLTRAGYEVQQNTIFKGGYITRGHGKPDQGLHTIQLEMCKNLYCEDDEITWSESRGGKMRKLFSAIFEDLIHLKL